MESHFGGLRKMTKLPDVVFVTSLKEGTLPIREAKRMKIKTTAIVNTDSSPEDVDCAIPANDRSKKSVDLILDAIKNRLTLKD